MNTLVAMELKRDRQMVNLKLVDDGDKIYPLEQWKVAQDSYQAETLNIPGVTEQQISFFDKELDAIDENVIKDNKDALNLELKKKIILHHLPVYKAAFDFLLVSMIADNICNNRVQAEKAYLFEPKSVKKFMDGFLYIPPINKLGLDTFNGKVPLDDKGTNVSVMTNIPLSTMSCVAFNSSDDMCNVHVYKIKNNEKYKSIGIVQYDARNINGLGVTTDLKYLVATFDNNTVSKAALYSDDDFNAYKDVTHNIKLADIYLLFHLYQAKKEERRADMQDHERDYVRDHIAKTEKGKDLIRKYFLS